jgi:predicted AlkP superfamily phosphohydrolase/phosphomutase
VLSELGKRVVVANVPMTFPPEPVNGIMLSGYMAPDMKANVTYPLSFKEELLQAVPDYQIDLNPAVSGGQIGNVFTETLKMTRKRNAMFRLLLSKPWDFFFIAYSGADRIQHLHWDEIIAFHPQAVEYYQMLDEALGMALDALNADDMLMIVSDHGFQGVHHKFYIQEYLYRQGLLQMKKTSTRRRAEFIDVARQLIRTLQLQGLANQLRSQLRHKGIIEVEKEHHRAKLPDLEWVNTYAWLPSSSGSIGGYADIFLHESLTEERLDGLMRALREIHDPETGQPLALEMHREEAFGVGPFAPSERHLVLLSGEDIILATELGRRALWETSGNRSMGIHHPDGVLYLYGTQIKKGITIARTHVYDVVPTILSYMGMPLSQELDGKFMEEAFEKPLTRYTSTRGDGSVMKKLKKITM